MAKLPKALPRAVRSHGTWDAEEQGSDPVGGYSLILHLFLRRLEDGLGVWAHSGRAEQLPQAEAANNSSHSSGTGWGSAIASSSELTMPSSPHSAIALRQKAAEQVSQKGSV